MLQIIIIIVLLAAAFFVIKNMTDKPLTQHLKNKDNKDQREHERYQDERKREFWLAKNTIKNKEKKEKFVRDFAVDYINNSLNIDEDKKLYIVNKLISELQRSDSNMIEGDIDEYIKKISQDAGSK